MILCNVNVSLRHGTRFCKVPLHFRQGQVDGSGVECRTKRDTDCRASGAVLSNILKRLTIYVKGTMARGKHSLP